MKKEEVFLFIGTLVFVFSGPAIVWGAAANLSAAEAALAAYEKSLSMPAVSVPAEPRQPQAAPRWSSSLGEIQSVSVGLLETNGRLTAEETQLKQTVDGLQARISELQTGNVRAEEEIEQLRTRREEDGSGEVFKLKNMLSDREHQIKAQKESLAVLKVKERNSQNRIALARLQVAGLEVEKRSREVDMKIRDEATFKALRAESALINDQIAKGEAQIRLLHEKTIELGAIEQPYVPQAREIAARNAELRGRLSVIQASLTSQQAKLQDVMARKFKAESGRNIRIVQQFLAERSALDTRLKEAGTRLEALRMEDAGVGEPVLDTGLIEKLERQNAAIENEVSNLRENIALLEYKINGLERYKGRNDPGPKQK